MIVGLLAVAMACPGCSGIPRQEPPAPSPLPASSETTVVVNPSGPCCKTSIWDILGIPQIAKVGGFVLRRARSRLGARFPGLEPQPELLPLADPANLESPYPSVQVAAEVKAEEDAAPQKIKAISYLATIGCSGCYPDVEKALLASLDDCNEEVRYATVVALRETAGSPCKACKAASCCSAAIMRKLEELATKTNAQGCYVEPSARVRRMARLAMRGCGGLVPAEPEPEPIEGPAPTDLEGPTPAPPPAPAPAPEAPPPAPPPGPTARNHEAPVSPAGMRSVLISPPECCVQSTPAPAHGVAALVNGEPIAYSEIATEVQRRLAADTTASPESVWRQVLADAIDHKLLRQDASRAGFTDGVMLAAYNQSPAGPASGAPTLAADARLAEQWLQTRVRVDESVEPQEVWGHYRTHLARYRHPARVRFESITARRSAFSTPQQAQKVIAYLRDEALGGATGAPPAEVDLAAAASHDWTGVEGVASSQVWQTLMTMPIGAVSPILETPDGYQVVRLLERRLPQTIPWNEAADQIRREILTLRRSRAVHAYLEELRRTAQIWNSQDGEL